MSLYGFVGSSWGDVPDLDPGRNPFPRNKKGRYAIGERKTALVLYVGIHDRTSEEAMVSSLQSVLSSSTNRLYVDILFVHAKSLPSFVEDQRKKLETEDCLVSGKEPLRAGDSRSCIILPNCSIVEADVVRSRSL